MPAGPSELLVIADAEADPELVAADLLSQAEHDAAAQVLLVTPSPELADSVATRLAAMTADLPAARRWPSVARKCPHPARRHARRGGRDRQSLRARASVARGRRSGRAARPGPQCRRRLCRRPGGRDVRRLSRRIEPRPSHRRRRPRLERGFGPQLPEGDQRADGDARGGARPRPAGRRARPARGRWRRMPAPPTPGSRSRPRHDLARRAPGPAAKSWRCRRSTFRRTRTASFPRRRDPARRQRESLSAAGRGRAFGRRQPLSGAAAGPPQGRHGRALWRPARTAGRHARRRRRDRHTDPRLLPARRSTRSRSARRPSAAYAHFARLQGARLVEVPLDEDFDFDADAFPRRGARDESVAEARLPLLAQQPDRQRDRSGRRCFASPTRCPRRSSSLDEAYIEFADAESLAPEAARRPNLVVLRTLSKAYGLAGARIGAAIGDAELIAMAARALPPYPLPSPCRRRGAGRAAPARRPIHEERIRRIKADRERLAGPARRRARHREVVRSGGGNFLFLEVDEPEALAAKLRAGSASASVSARMRRPAASTDQHRHRGRECRPARRARAGAGERRTDAAPSWCARPRKRRSRSPSTSTGRAAARSTPACPSSITCSTRSPRMAASR